MARAIFRPTPKQYRLFTRIRDHVCAHPADFADPVALILRMTDASAAKMSHDANRTFARLVEFGRKASQWDLTHLRSDERLLRARAILYATWLMTDPEAGERGLNVSSMEQTPMLAPDVKLDDPSACLDRGWAKWEVFDPMGEHTKAWWRQLKLACDELHVTSLTTRGDAGATARERSRLRPLGDTQSSSARGARTRATARQGWILLMAAVDRFDVSKSSLHDWTRDWGPDTRRKNHKGHTELRVDALKRLLGEKRLRPRQ